MVVTRAPDRPTVPHGRGERTRGGHSTRGPAFGVNETSFPGSARPHEWQRPAIQTRLIKFTENRTRQPMTTDGITRHA